MIIDSGLDNEFGLWRYTPSLGGVSNDPFRDERFRKVSFLD
jgi:hypothetical protein